MTCYSIYVSKTAFRFGLFGVQVNCNTYNADFDGDEMNLHAPQVESTADSGCGVGQAVGVARRLPGHEVYHKIFAAGNVI